MKAEIISVGTELLLGHTINSDAAFVARELAQAGIDIQHMQVVGDNPARLAHCLENALKNSDLVITTGGLGPTCDDLTKETVARLANAPLVMDASSHARLKEYFGSRPMSENQLKQAMVPEGATVFPNQFGTAPGCAVPFASGKFVVLLPGPPRELVPMLENEVRPFLQAMNGGLILSRTIRTFGIGEGMAAQILNDLMDGSNPTVAPYATDGEMFVKITAKGADAAECEKLCAPIVAEVNRLLGNVVYGTDVASIEEVVVHELARQKMKIATAESCTGGLLAKKITDISGSSSVFNLGLVTYSNEAKTRFLNVPEAMLEKFGAVSGQVARTMALNVRALAGSDFGVGITGIAGPEGGSNEKPVGLVYIALAFEGGCWLRVMRPQGRYLGREWTRSRAASHALDLARRKLANLPREIS